MPLAALLPVALAFSSISSPPPPPAWTDGYVLANGIRIHYWRTGGDKPPLVLAHGSSDDGLCWTNLAKELEARFDVIMYDARGHGLSDPPSPGDPPDVQVEDLAGLIKELKLQKPILMGHSMGSTAVAHFAAKYPDVPRAVVLEDPALLRPAGAAAPGPSTATPESRAAAILARNNTTEEALVAGCMKNSPKWGRSECEVWAPSKRRHHPRTALVAGRRPPMSELLPKIAAPTLILKADADHAMKKGNEEVANLLKSGKIVHIRGAGHNVRREGREETLQVLNAFLEGLPPAAGSAADGSRQLRE